MKEIKIKLVDFNKYSILGANDIIKILQSKYKVVYSDNPDYIFFSVFGNEHLKTKYNNCIRIFYTAECYTPNFNECDYAIGFDRFDIGDRYIRMPLFYFTPYRQYMDMLTNRRPFTREDLKTKTEFCNYVVSNSFVKDRRTQIYLELCKYKKVNSGGRYMNNIGGAVKDKFTFQQKHKFSIAFENTSYDGYCTEKIVEAFAAGTIPIYWGDPRVTEDFNNKAFINYHDLGSLEAVVEKVIEIDNNEELFIQMMNEPIVQIKESNLSAFLFNIIDQPIETAYRRPCSITSIAEERRKLRHYFFEKYIYTPYKRGLNQIYRLRNHTLLTGKRTK